MLIDRRRGLGVLTSVLTLSLLFLSALPLWGAEKVRLRVDDYQIQATLQPHLHQITAKAKVKLYEQGKLPHDKLPMLAKRFLARKLRALSKSE